jgi:predicted permease
MVFAAALTLGTGLLFGLFPALHSTRPDVMATLKGQSGNTTDGRAASRFRTVLVTGQIALSMALLIAAGLFLRSLNNTLQVDLGFDPGRLGLFSISPELNGYSYEQSRALFVRVEEELAGLPGVASASASMVPLLSGSNWGTSVSVQGFERGPDTDAGAQINVVGPGYFRTLGIPLLAGREFTAADAGDKSPKVAIVNEAFARKFNLGRDAVGKRMADGNSNDLDTEIVGLVPDSRYAEVRDAAPPQLFRPYRQDPPGSMTFYIRTTLDPAQVLQNVRPLISRLDANLPVEATLTMRQQIDENLTPDRIVGKLSASFALLATLLAAVGLYGVLAYSVSQRTKEIGLRVALGAEPSHVRRMVLRQTVLMLGVGTVIGLAIGIGFGQLAESLLFELKGYDPAVLVIAAGVLALVALAASALPAYRASRIDPMKALRYE